MIHITRVDHVFAYNWYNTDNASCKTGHYINLRMTVTSRRRRLWLLTTIYISCFKLSLKGMWTCWKHCRKNHSEKPDLFAKETMVLSIFADVLYSKMPPIAKKYRMEMSTIPALIILTMKLTKRIEEQDKSSDIEHQPPFGDCKYRNTLTQNSTKDQYRLIRCSGIRMNRSIVPGIRVQPPQKGLKVKWRHCDTNNYYSRIHDNQMWGHEPEKKNKQSSLSRHLN